MKKIILSMILAFSVILPTSVALADDNAFELNVGIENPLGSGKDNIKDIIASIMKVIVDIAIPIVVVMVIYSGFLLVMAQGNPDKLKEAKKTITWTLVGATILLGAQLISTVLVETVSNVSKDAVSSTK